MNDTQVYQLDAPGRRTERVQASKLVELKMGLVRLGLPDIKASSVAGAIWGERGGAVRGPGYSVEHVGTMHFEPIRPPTAVSAKKSAKSNANGGVLKPRAVRPASLTAPDLEGDPFTVPVNDQAVNRLFEELEGSSS